MPLRQSRSFALSPFSTAQTFTFSSSVLAGSLLLLYIHNAPTGATTTDSLNAGSWTRDNSYFDAGTSTRAGLFRKENTAAGSPTITFTPNAFQGNSSLVIMEFTGVAISSPLDGSTGATGFGGTTLSSGSYTPGQASALLFGASFANSPGSDPDAAWTSLFDDNYVVMSYREVAAAGAYSYVPTHTSGSFSWQTTLTAYKLATESYKRLGLLGVG